MTVPQAQAQRKHSGLPLTANCPVRYQNYVTAADLSYTVRRIISVVTVHAADQLTAIAGAMAVVSDALRHPVVSPAR